MRAAAAASDVDLREAEGGVLGGDPHVADRCQHASGAERRPVHSGDHRDRGVAHGGERSEEHTSELQSLMRISYAVFCLKKKKQENKQRRMTYRIYTNDQAS